MAPTSVPRAALPVALLMCACLSTEHQVCPSGLICPPGTTCHDSGTCATDSQRRACEDRSSGEDCTLSTGGGGQCKDGICVPDSCGDGRITAPEQCEGDDLGGKTCEDFGYHGVAGLACVDCSFDFSSCLEQHGICGDAIVNGGEACDRGAPIEGTTCLDFGFYQQGGGLACTAACTFDTSECSETCGDDVVNGPELCDGAPPAGQSCLSYGFDRGNIACGGNCAPAFAGCAVIGWQAVDVPGSATIVDLWGPHEDRLFAVGEGGSILTYDGSSWQEMSSPTTADLLAVTGTAEDDVFAVAFGEILHYDGTAWSVTEVEEILEDVWAAAPDRVWAAGRGGALLEYDGSTWSTVASSTNERLTALGGTGPDDVWAVGSSGTAVHFDGTSWASIGLPTGEDLKVVWSAGPDDVWAAGSVATLVHYDGSGWETVPVPQELVDGGARFESIWGSSPSDVWMFASSTTGSRWLYHHDGERWTPMAVDADVGAGVLWGFGPAQIWMTSDPGLLARYSGSSWAEIPPTPGSADEDIRAGWVDADGSMIVGGGDGMPYRYDGIEWIPQLPTASVWHYDGTSWSPTDGYSSEIMEAVWASDDGKVFAVGHEGVVLRFDGASWLEETSPTSSTLWAVWGATSTDVHAVGRFGALVHYDGIEWQSQTAEPLIPTDPPPGSDLWDVWGASASEVFAVGKGGTILHYDGTSWTEQASPTDRLLRALWGRSGADVYAVGNAGASSPPVVLHYDGSSWSELPSPAIDAHLYAVWGTTDALFAAASDGEIWRYQDDSWSLAVATSAQLLDMWGASADLRAVGRTMARFDGSAWSEVDIQPPLPFVSLHGTASDDIYAVREHPSNTAFHVLGRLGAFNFYEAHSQPTGERYLGSTRGGLLVELAGTWYRRANPAGSVQGLWTSASELVIVDGGELHHHDGSWTSSSVDPASVTLTSAWGLASNDVFATGYDGNEGRVLHFDGSSWSVEPIPAVKRLEDIWGDGMGSIYAVGVGGTVLHFDGTQWSLQSVPTQKDLTRVRGTSAGEVFAAGEDETLLFHDGLTWTPVRAPEGESFLGLIVDGAQIYLLSSEARVHMLLRSLPWTCSAQETVCNDGWDEDCDGAIDCDDSDCAC